MERLLEAVTAVVCLVSPEKVRALTGAIRKIEDVKANVAVCYVFLSQRAEARAHPANGEALRRNAS